ncbi:MAG: CBS domain-containing protein [Candidatus Aenigmarchaeota archaeon]|nr:CBS domain-containing protein [Candidatus Aenigmarchaeota archaeon]
MKVRDIMTANVVSATPDEIVSSALSKMKKYGLHQLPVIEKELHGMLLLKKIVTKDIDAANTKVNALMSQTTAASPEDDIRRAAELVILSGQRALPVVERNKVIGIISETDIMRAIGQMAVSYKTQDVMSPCEYVSKDDNIGKVKKVMTYNNVSRVPVVEDGRIIGVVGTLDLVDLILRKEPMRGGARQGGTKEIISIDKTSVESIMKNAVTIDKTSRLEKVAELLFKNEEVFVEDNGRICVITPKDLVELVASSKAGAYVQITNLKGEDPLVVAKMQEKAAELVKKIGHMANIQSFVIHIDKHEKGGKPRYDIRARFLSSYGMFVSKSSGWDLVSITQDAIDNLEREVLKRHDRVAHHERAKKSKELMRE